MPGQITITNLVGASNSDGSVTKSAADGWGNAGYSSFESISGDGYIDFVVTETNTDRMVGLSTIDTDQNFTTIEYAFYFDSANVLRIYQSGSHQGGFGSLTANITQLRIKRNGTSIEYYKDDI